MHFLFSLQVCAALSVGSHCFQTFEGGFCSLPRLLLFSKRIFFCSILLCFPFWPEPLEDHLERRCRPHPQAGERCSHLSHSPVQSREVVSDLPGLLPAAHHEPVFRCRLRGCKAFRPHGCQSLPSCRGAWAKLCSGLRKPFTPSMHQGPAQRDGIGGQRLMDTGGKSPSERRRFGARAALLQTVPLHYCGREMWERSP